MINPALYAMPEHALLIGHMVIGYSDLEITFSHIGGLALGLRYEVLYATSKVYSETQKINVIHRLSKRAFHAQELGDAYDTVVSMMLVCASTRNRYAHCQWRQNFKLRTDNLEFAFDDEMFKNWPVTEEGMPWRPIRLETLKAQEAYFECTRKWLLWIEGHLMWSKAKNYMPPLLPPKMPAPPEDSLPPKPKSHQPKKAPSGKPPKPAGE